jgi:hypothetical protein
MAERHEQLRQRAEMLRERVRKHHQRVVGATGKA